MYYFAILFFLTSCTEMLENIGCTPPSYVMQEKAKSYYEDIFTARTDIDYDEGREIFGCNYHLGDKIYSYKRPFSNGGYILVRNGSALTYKEK